MVRERLAVLLLALISFGTLLPSSRAFQLQRQSPLEVRLRTGQEDSSALFVEGRSHCYRRWSSSSSPPSLTRLYVASPRKPTTNKKNQQQQQRPKQQPASSKDGGKKEKKITSTGSGSEGPMMTRFVPPTPHDENRGSKFRKLKDMIWIRETVEDLTAAEFACSVEDTTQQGDGKRRRAVDYDKLLGQLNMRLRDLGCALIDEEGSSNDDDIICELDPKYGMGTTVYNDEEREELYEKILTTRNQLIGVVRGYKLELEKEEDSMPFKINLPSIPQIQKEQDENVTSASGPKLYVRDDGTLDWDGALQDRAALQMFGTAVWARINGRDPASVSDDDDGEDGNNGLHGHGTEEKEVTAKIEDTPQIVEARDILTKMKSELKEMEIAHIKLLRTALSEGQPDAKVNLASLEPELRSQIRESADLLDMQKQQVSYKTLVYEMERIYTYLVGEVGNPATKGYVPLQDRLNVAELGLLEAQIESFTRDIQAGRNVDADVLTVVGDQVTDLKRRLGIDFYVQGVTFDAEAIKRALGDLLVQTKNGLAFYGRGCQLFWNDLIFCGFLLGRAVQGYTLKPREVRNLRRTIKDLFTFIPFIIILLIPLSPIGHVLVFGAIQRFFPEFFPSCFTEQRQNLLQLYETAEYSEFKINETFQQKVSRLGIAAVYFLGNVFRGLAVRISSLLMGTAVEDFSSLDDAKANGIDDNSAMKMNGSSETKNGAASKKE